VACCRSTNWPRGWECIGCYQQIGRLKMELEWLKRKGFSGEFVGRVGRIGWLSVSAMTMRRREDHLRSIDLERHQIRVQCAFQRAEPKDTCDDRPQTPTSHRGREAGENQEQLVTDERFGSRSSPLVGTYPLSRSWRNRLEVLPGRPTRSLTSPAFAIATRIGLGSGGPC
jgi:hypothetical protein